MRLQHGWNASTKLTQIQQAWPKHLRCIACPLLHSETTISTSAVRFEGLSVLTQPGPYIIADC